MALTDHHDVFIGTTADGVTFIVLNRHFQDAERVLTKAGFTADQLAPELAEEVNDRAGLAVYSLLAHTTDLVDLSGTTRWGSAGPSSEPELYFRFVNGTVTATAKSDTSRALLTMHGFTRTAGSSSYRAPAGLGERALVNVVVRADSHAFVNGLSVRIDLGIATPDALRGAPRHSTAAVLGGPATEPTQRRTR
ncbi:hypothetical protein [Streptomyces decoyicus]|uniref:hypothetical protein n=1 Tax=Streptomyces decoyicus TaxID=249567 RepID=UPI00386872A6